MPPAEAYGVATFYAMFSLVPRPARVVHVCDDIACKTRGADAICRSLTEKLGPAGEPVAGGAAMWMRSPCLGLCEQAPVALVQQAGDPPVDRAMPDATVETIVAAVNDVGRGFSPGGHAGPEGPAYSGPRGRAAGLPWVPQTMAPRDPSLRLLRRVGVADPTDLDDYRAHGGYAALRRAFEIGPEHVMREVGDAELVGRGGAAFPARRKAEAVARSPVRPHYLVCNADESEPGTFKDRVLMEEDPFAIVEAMTIAGFATGCEQGYLYIRGEYPLATARLRRAIDQARRRGLLGDNIMGEGVRFDIELRRGAGAYICGEETALLNSIEGRRGEPRNKPPFPVQVGLFGKPTLINNVETFANLPDIVLAGGPTYAATGTAGSAGTKLFCVSGCVEKPGLYEEPFGITLRELIEQAGGVRGGRALQAVLLGGAAGVFVTPDELDMPLTLRGHARGRRHARLGRRDALRRLDRPARHRAAHRDVLSRRVVRPVRAVPRRHDSAGGVAAPAGVARPPFRRARSSGCCGTCRRS